MRIKPLFVATPAVLAAAFDVPAHATDWLQFGYDTVHSSFNTAETGYPTALNTILYHYALPAAAGTADNAPVYLGGVATNSGTKNLLFVVTKNGTLLALDADSPTLNVLWSKQPQAPIDSKQITHGSPAVDPSLQFVYAYAHDGKIHKYQVGDGTEIMTGGWPEVTTLKPNVEKGAAGLSISTDTGGTTYLYSVIDGYIGDAGDYQGHVTTINLATGAQKVFNSLCSGLTIHFIENGVKSGAGQNDCASAQNGIWGRPGAIYDAGTNRVFITTGNGPYNASTGGFNWGDSVLALNPDGSGAGGGMPVDSYTPTTFQNLQNTDADLGSESIAIVPPPAGTAAQYQHIAVQAGKDGCIRLINLFDLSGQGTPGKTGGEIQAVNFPGGHCATGSDGPEIKPQPAVWVNPADGSSWVYVASYNNGMLAYKIVLDGNAKPSLAKQWPIDPMNANATAASGTSPIVANGVLYYMSGNHINALDATTGTSLLSGSSPWLTTAYGGQHWQSPIIANGRIYATDNGTPSQLWVFQLDGAFKSGFE